MGQCLMVFEEPRFDMTFLQQTMGIENHDWARSGMSKPSNMPFVPDVNLLPLHICIIHINSKVRLEILVT